MITANFSKTKLGNWVTVIMRQSPSGESCSEDNSGVPLLNGPTEFSSRFPVPVQYTTDPKKIAKQGDLLFCVRGSTTGRMNWADQNYAIGRGVAALRHKKDIRLQPFLKGLIDNYLPILLKQATGSTFPNVSKDMLENLEINCPELPMQMRIASIFSAYDDLIENNEKRIKNLEEMAQLLYAEWFVKFKFPGHEKVKMIDSKTEYGLIPEALRIVKLGDKVRVFKGRNITRKTIIDGQVPVVAGGLQPAYYHNKPNANGTVITISASGANAGFVNLYFEDIWASDCSFITEEATPFVYFYYLLLKNRQAQVTNLQKGAAQPHVYPQDVMGLSCLDIQESLLSDFECKVDSIFSEINNLKKQQRALSKTRDLLIPQLVAGKRELKNYGKC